jgi:hypothetical protein
MSSPSITEYFRLQLRALAKQIQGVALCIAGNAALRILMTTPFATPAESRSPEEHL